MLTASSVVVSAAIIRLQQLDEAEDEIEQELQPNSDEEVAAVLKSNVKSRPATGQLYNRPVSSKSKVVPLEAQLEDVDDNDGNEEANNTSNEKNPVDPVEKPKKHRRRLIRAKTLNDVFLVLYGFIFVISVIALVAHLANTIRQTGDSQAPKGVSFSPLKTYNAKLD